LAAPRYSWVAEVHLPSQGRTQGQSWKKQEEERSHLQKRRALAGIMNYVYSERSKEQHASSCHAHARQRGSNGGSTSHPRPDTHPARVSYGGCTMRTCKNVMLKSAIDTQASCRGWSTGTSPARRTPIRSCRGSLLRRTRCGIRWSAVTQRRAALRASGRNYWPSLSCEAGLGQLEPLRAQLQHGASSAWSALEYENLDGLLGNSSVK